MDVRKPLQSSSRLHFGSSRFSIPSETRSVFGQISGPSMFLFEALELSEGCNEGDGLLVRSQTRVARIGNWDTLRDPIRQVP
jgi:hypothetical protein